MVDAIERLEAAEQQGLWSPLWQDTDDLPAREGWAHRVRGGRDEWIAVTSAPHSVLVVTAVILHVAPDAWGERPRTFRIAGDTCASDSPLRFIAQIDEVPLTQPGQSALDGTVITPFREAEDAMAAVEGEAVERFAAAGVNRPMTLLEIAGAVAPRVILERA
jgi:hypothetical protein